MSNPTRQEIIDAHTAVTTLARLAEEFTPVRVEEHKEINDLHLAVRAALPPRPRPTMAEIKWDDEKHYLAEADHATTRKVIMLHPTSDGKIECLNKWDGLYRIYWLTPEYLTPTGKRYTLTEVE